MTLRALLIDVDGTLADTETLGHRPAYNRAFRQLGVGFRWGPDLYRRLLRQPGGRERLLYYLRNFAPDLGTQADAISVDMEGWVDRAHALKTRYFKNYLRQGKVPLRPGVARLIREARTAGLRIALVSNATPASLKPILEYGLGVEMAGRLDLIVSGHDVPHKKPAPDPYLFALRQLRLSPHECVVLEDSALGMQSARAAGIPTVIVCNGNTREDDFSGAELVLDSLGEASAPAAVLRGELIGQCLSLADLERIARRQPKQDCAAAA